MENITYKTDTYGDEHVIIKHTDGSETSMLKSTYEAQQVEHLTEIVADEAKAK